MNNLALLIDRKNNKIRAMLANSKQLRAPKCYEIPIETDDTRSIDYATIFGNHFENFVATNKILPCNATIILPNEEVAMDIVTIPIISRLKKNDTIRTEVANTFDSIENFKYSVAKLSSDKTQATYAVPMALNATVNKIKEIFTNLKFGRINCTLEGNCLNNAILNLRPTKIFTSFIVADIKEHLTLISMCSKGTTCGYATLPFGTDILSSEQSLTPQMLAKYRADNMQKPSVPVSNAIFERNFENISKYIVGYYYSTQTYSKITADSVIINIDERYRTILEKMKKQLSITQFYDARKENNHLITDNLELYGALVASNYNKNFNF